MSDSEMAFVKRTQRIRCIVNTEGELNKDLSSTNELCVCELRCTSQVWYRGKL